MVEKVAADARSIWAKILTAGMIVVGFIALLLNVRMRGPGAHFSEYGVAHADAPGGGVGDPPLVWGCAASDAGGESAGSSDSGGGAGDGSGGAGDGSSGDSGGGGSDGSDG